MLTWKALHTNFRNAFTVTSSEGSRRYGLGTSWADAFADCCDHELGLLFGFPRCQSCLSLLFCWCQVRFFEGRHLSFGMCVSLSFFLLLLKSWKICDNVCILDYCYRILRFFVGFFPIFSRWWFQILFIFPIWGRFPIWLIFFKGVGSTTNQFSISIHVFVFWFSIISSCIHSATIVWIRWFFAVFSKPRGWRKKRRSGSQRNAGISRFVYKLPPRSRDDQGQSSQKTNASFEFNTGSMYDIMIYIIYFMYFHLVDLYGE